MLLPYRPDLPYYRFPVVTVLIGIASLWVFYLQQETAALHRSAIEMACDLDSDPVFAATVERITGHADLNHCGQLMTAIQAQPDKRAFVTRYLQNGSSPPRDAAGTTPAAPADAATTLLARYEIFKNANVDPITEVFAYNPRSFNLLQSITAKFLHRDLWHLLANVVTFVIFAAAVEIIIGSVPFMLLVVIIGYLADMAYSLAVMNAAQIETTLGLSSVTLGMLGLFFYFVPTMRIRCLVWRLRSFTQRTLAPGWFVAAYLAVEIGRITNSSDISLFHFVEHGAGALAGVLIGVLLFPQRQQLLQPLQALSPRPPRHPHY